MIEKIDRNLFDYYWKKEPHAGLYKAVEVLLNKINELVEAQNTKVTEGSS